MTKTPAPPIEDEGPVIRPFADFLRDHNKGATHDELSETLHRLVSRVQDTGRRGTVALTITVAPLKDDPGVLVVSDVIKLKLPEHDRKASVFYADGDGNLTREDPNQLTFEGLREVPANVNPTTGEIREVQA